MTSLGLESSTLRKRFGSLFCARRQKWMNQTVSVEFPPDEFDLYLVLQE